MWEMLALFRYFLVLKKVPDTLRTTTRDVIKVWSHLEVYAITILIEILVRQF